MQITRTSLEADILSLNTCGLGALLSLTIVSTLSIEGSYGSYAVIIQ